MWWLDNHPITLQQDIDFILEIQNDYCHTIFEANSKVLISSHTINIVIICKLRMQISLLPIPEKNLTYVHHPTCNK